MYQIVFFLCVFGESGRAECPCRVRGPCCRLLYVERFLDGEDDIVRGRQRGSLQRLGIGQWHVRARNSIDRRVKIVERLAFNSFVP